MGNISSSSDAIVLFIIGFSCVMILVCIILISTIYANANNGRVYFDCLPVEESVYECADGFYSIEKIERVEVEK